MTPPRELIVCPGCGETARHYCKGLCGTCYEQQPRRRALRRWYQMVARCTRPTHHAWANYGGRGITVCPRWMDFETYYADTGDQPASGLSVDRIDNDGPYSPENIRWATSRDQNWNKRNAPGPRDTCAKGHPYGPDATRGNRRVCLECHRERDHAYRQRRRQSSLARSAQGQPQEGAPA